MAMDGGAGIEQPTAPACALAGYTAPKNDKKDRPPKKRRHGANRRLRVEHAKESAAHEITKHKNGASSKERSWQKNTHVRADKTPKRMGNNEADKANESRDADDRAYDARAREERAPFEGVSVDPEVGCRFLAE
jgi:hypothetical protein